MPRIRRFRGLTARVASRVVVAVVLRVMVVVRVPGLGGVSPGSAFRRHVAVGALVLAAIAAVAVLVTFRVGNSQAMRQPVAGGEVVATRIVAPLVTQGVYDGDTEALKLLEQRVGIRKAGSTIEHVKVWSADGVILYCDDPRLIGQRYPFDSADRAALTSGTAESSIADPTRSENVLDQGLGRSIEVSAGVRDTLGRPILVQTFFTPDQVDTDEAAFTHRTIAIALVSLLAFGLLLLPLAYSLSRRTTR